MDQYSFNRADFNKGVNESLGAIVVIAAVAALVYGGPHAVRGVKKGATIAGRGIKNASIWTWNKAKSPFHKAEKPAEPEAVNVGIFTPHTELAE